MRKIVLAVLAALLAPVTGHAASSRPTIVAAENFYGELARAIAGPEAEVVSILSNPDQDPHLFEADPSTARALARAGVVIANGAAYDPWIDKLAAATATAGRVTIVAADLVGRRPGDNPHIWYDPATMRAVAGRLAAVLEQIDPANMAAYAANAAAYTARLAPLETQITLLKSRHAGKPVTASEPVFGYMATALGLVMRNEAFQRAVMNDTEPSPADVAAFEDDLRRHRVRAMITNSQAENAAVKRLVGIAREAQIPVVGVTETEPAGTSYEAWMAQQLTALDRALEGGRS